MQATAQAWIETKVEEPVASCTTTVKEKVKGVAQKAKGKKGGRHPWRDMNRGRYIVRHRTTTQEPVRFDSLLLCACACGRLSCLAVHPFTCNATIESIAPCKSCAHGWGACRLRKLR